MLTHTGHVSRGYPNPDTLPVCKRKSSLQSLRELTNCPVAHRYPERIRFCISRQAANRLTAPQMQQVPRELPRTKPSENADGDLSARADQPHQRSAYRI